MSFATAHHNGTPADGLVQLCQMYANLFEEIAMNSVNHGSVELRAVSSSDNVVVWPEPNQGSTSAADQPPAAEGVFDVDQFM